MTENLKRCPFCGSEAEIIGYDDGMYQCVCRNCESVQGGFYDFTEEAAFAWNSRPIEDELPEKIEKLEAENARLREALEFYAELDGNGIQLYGDMDSKALEFVDGDSQIFGTIAKDALKGNKK